MPLELRHIRNLDKKPLPSSVLETGLDNAKLHGPTRVNKNFGKLGRLPSPDLPPNALSEVKNARPDDESPAEVTQTVLGGIEWEACNVVRVNSVAHETTGRMRVESDHEEEREMMGVPKRLEALLADLLMSRRVHEDKDEKHEMAGDAARLGVVNLLGGDLPNLSAFDIDEVDIMSSGVHHCPERQLIGDLSVKPDIFVGREGPGKFGADETNDVTEHREKDETSIVCKHKTGATGCPDGPCQGVKTSQFLIRGLAVPTITKPEEVRAVEEDVEDQSSGNKELSMKPAFSHELTA